MASSLEVGKCLVSGISQVAWPLIGKYSCDITTSSCAGASNRGWRYFLFTMGALMLVLWAVRFFAFRLYESPKYLMGKGKDEHAVKVIHRIARYNGKISSLSLEDLQSVDKEFDGKAGSNGKRKVFDSTSQTLRRHLSIFDGNHVKPLFATRKLAISTMLLIVLWGEFHESRF